jgi:hypothetical protein
MERGVGKVRKALTLLMGHYDPLFLSPSPGSGSGKGQGKGSYFEAISGVFPYPNGSCKKIGFHIELQIYAIGMGWLLLALPPLRTARASSPAYGSSGEGPFLRAW